MNKHQKKVKDTLVGERVVEEKNNGQYIVGKVSKQFRLAEPYCDVRYRRENIRKATVATRLEKSRFANLKPVTPIHKTLVRWLKQLEIDDRAASQSIEKLQGHAWNCLSPAIEMIAGKHFYFLPDDYGRVHTNLTNLRKSLRQYLRYRGKPLVNVDVACSQPLFLYILMSTKNTRYTPIHTQLPTQHPYDRRMMDVVLYSSLVSRGLLYEHIMKKSENSDRDSAKKAFIASMYCRNKPWMSEDEKLFEAVFPTVYKFCREFKQSGYRELAHTLQRQESAFVLDGVCTRLTEEYPDVPLFTIHDSIMTTADCAELVKNAFLDEAEQFGISPTIKIES